MIKNIAIILSGGQGIRLGSPTPKQYLEVASRPIIAYCLETFEHNSLVDAILIVINPEWKDCVEQLIRKNNITKFIGFADAGKSRQHSIKNALVFLKNINIEKSACIMIHDAVRPNVNDAIINACVNGIDDFYDGVMPVISVKDTVYLSKDGNSINSLLNRNELFAGQTPESFKFRQYFSINEHLSDDQLTAVKGSSEIAYKNGMKIRLVPGSEANYKITTSEDLVKFKLEKE